MRILVTGANGYVGQGVVKKLLDMGFQVIATDFSLEHVDSRADKISSNLFDIDNPFMFFESPDLIIHLAWRDGFEHGSENHLIDLPKHYAFIKKLVDAGIKKVCVIGSMHEIGFYEGSIDEYTPCAPQSLYGISKNALRQSLDLLTKTKKIKFQWLRGYYIVGNTEYGCSIFSKISSAVREGEKDFPFTSGQNQFDFIDYKDFCKQIALAATQDKILGIINCCSGKPEKLANRVEQYIYDNHYNIRLAYGTFPDRPYDSKAVWGNDDKIKSILLSSQDLSSEKHKNE